MKTPSLTLAAFALFAVGCTEPTPTSPEASARPLSGGPLFANQGNGVVARVSVGGHDADISLDPGDKNFSLIALLRADGTSDGQWVDMFGGDQGGIHVDVDCVRIDGNSATISGIIKNGTLNGVDVTGQRALTRVWDNGTSANDPPDGISFSFFPVGVSCNFAGALPQLAMTKGQVTIN